MVSNDSWTLEFNEASRLADEINNMISRKSSLPQAGPEAQRHLSATRRKVTILRTKLETLQSLLSKLPTQQQISSKEMKRRQDSLANLTSKCNEMATSLNMSNFGNRDSLLGPEKKQDDLVNRTVGLDNHGIVGFQRQVMKEQDEGLEKLEETVLSTKHIALAVNEELNLHTTLLDNLEQDVDATNTRLQWAQKKLSLLNKRTKGGCCSMILVVIAMVALIFVIYGLVKFL